MGLIKDIRSLENDYMKITDGYFMFKYMKNFYCIHKGDFDSFIERIDKGDVDRLNVLCKYFEKHSDESESDKSSESSESEESSKSSKSEESSESSESSKSEESESEHSESTESTESEHSSDDDSEN